MSNVNVSGVIKNHGVQSNMYTPLIEAVVNSLEAIEERGNPDGQITIHVVRDKQSSLGLSGKSKEGISGFVIVDNGIGFTQKNRDSFDTFYSSHKAVKGGKGFGRFMYKKYFERVDVDSVYEDISRGQRMRRIFRFGDNDEIVDSASEQNVKVEADTEVETSVTLAGLKRAGVYPKEVETIAKQLLEKILVRFITDGYTPPVVRVVDASGTTVVLNKLATDSADIVLQKNTSFNLPTRKGEQHFKLKIFNIYAPGNQKSKIVLTAHGREVEETPVQNYVTEYSDEFVDSGDADKKRNFVIRAYVLGDYLDEHVTMERDMFTFEREKELFHPLSRADIERATVSELEKHYKTELESRRTKKVKRVKEFMQDNPWYRDYENEIDLDALPMNPTKEQIDSAAHEIGYRREVTAKAKASQLLDEFDVDAHEQASEVFSLISSIKKNELAHYLSLRRVFLGVLAKALQIDDETKQHEKEDMLHNIIFPTKKDSDEVAFDEHNLWILDERLAFVEYLRSDKPLSGGKSRRPDIVVFDKAVMFRGGDEPSNPITVFEFKRPGRDDFADNASKEDPYEQVVSYVQMIKEGKYKTPQNREIQVGENTPFYGYIVADISPKVRAWLQNKDFHPLPNHQRWFKWQRTYNLYVEFLTWDCLVKDAEQRNSIFFKKLGI